VCEGGVSDLTYRCSFCRVLLKAALGHEGNLCPSCGTGHLVTIARVTKQMLAEAELGEALGGIVEFLDMSPAEISEAAWQAQESA
jgi:hypothetical protein